MILVFSDYDRVARHVLAGYLAYHDQRLLASSRGVEPHRSGSVKAAWNRHLADCATVAAFLDTTPYRIRTEVEAAAEASRELAATTVAMSARLGRKRDWVETAYTELAKRLEKVTDR